MAPQFFFCQQMLVICTKRLKKSYFLRFSAQMLMKGRLAGANKGHGLLKKKADALQMRFRMILGKIIEVFTFIVICVTFITYNFSNFFFLDKNINGRSYERGSIFIG